MAKSESVTARSGIIRLASRLSKTNWSAKLASVALLPSLLARQLAVWKTQSLMMRRMSGVTSRGSAAMGRATSWRTWKSLITSETTDRYTALKSNCSRLHCILGRKSVKIARIASRDPRIVAWVIFLITTMQGDIADLNRQLIESVYSTQARPRQIRHLQPKLKINPSMTKWLIWNRLLKRRSGQSKIWMSNLSKNMKNTKKNCSDSKKCRIKSWICPTNWERKIPNWEVKMTRSEMRILSWNNKFMSLKRTKGLLNMKDPHLWLENKKVVIHKHRSSLSKWQANPTISPA